jgi:hypothetical protein
MSKRKLSKITKNLKKGQNARKRLVNCFVLDGSTGNYQNDSITRIVQKSHKSIHPNAHAHAQAHPYAHSLVLYGVVSALVFPPQFV